MCDVLSGSERYGLVQLCPLLLYTVLEWVCVFSILVATAWVVFASPQHRPVGGLGVTPRTPSDWLSPAAQSAAAVLGNPAGVLPGRSQSHSCQPLRTAASHRGCQCRRLGTGSAHCCGRSLHSGSAGAHCRRH